ncbi:MAG: hypothetical protein ACLFT3_20965 [Cyclobacteriaceae bacterium]
MVNSLNTHREQKQAISLNELKVIWGKDGKEQVFREVKARQFLRLVEGGNLEVLPLQPIDFHQAASPLTTTHQH